VVFNSTAAGADIGAACAGTSVLGADFSITGSAVAIAVGVAAGAHAPSKKIVSVAKARVLAKFLKFIFFSWFFDVFYLFILSKMREKLVKELRRNCVDYCPQSIPLPNFAVPHNLLFDYCLSSNLSREFRQFTRIELKNPRN
jgi:hypothetical protein